jgi:hypothetical protein
MAGQEEEAPAQQARHRARIWEKEKKMKKRILLPGKPLRGKKYHSPTHAALEPLLSNPAAGKRAE